MEIKIEDSSQFGAILLFAELKRMGKKPELILGNGFLNSHGHVEVGNTKFNNGYHVFEMPRSEDLVRLLENFLGIKAKTYLKKNWIAFGHNLIDAETPLSEWPKSLKQELGIEDHTPPKDALYAFEEYLMPFHRRFGSDWETSKHLFIPYFLPSDLITSSVDEGAEHRRRVRQGKSRSEVAVFGDGLMSSLRELLRSQLEREDPKFLGISLEPSKDVVQKYQIKDDERFFTLTAHRILGGSGLPEAFEPFDEVLVVNPSLPEVNRVWFKKESDDYCFVITESYIDDESFDRDVRVKELGIYLSNLLKIPCGDLKLIGSKPTRVLSVEKLVKNKMWQRRFNVIHDSDEVRAQVVSLGTANMNKVFAEVKRVANSLDTVT